jgi:hypothetical protein
LDRLAPGNLRALQSLFKGSIRRFPFFIVKDSFTVSKSSQDANNSQNVKRDEVLKPLKMRPQPAPFQKI